MKARLINLTHVGARPGTEVVVACLQARDAREYMHMLLRHTRTHACIRISFIKQKISRLNISMIHSSFNCPRPVEPAAQLMGQQEAPSRGKDAGGTVSNAWAHP